MSSDDSGGSTNFATSFVINKIHFLFRLSCQITRQHSHEKTKLPFNLPPKIKRNELLFAKKIDYSIIFVYLSQRFVD